MYKIYSNSPDMYSDPPDNYVDLPDDYGDPGNVYIIQMKSYLQILWFLD